LLIFLTAAVDDSFAVSGREQKLLTAGRRTSGRRRQSPGAEAAAISNRARSRRDRDRSKKWSINRSGAGLFGENFYFANPGGSGLR
jgi:hypothetical protein